MSADGVQVPLVQVALAAAQSLNDFSAVDGVQPVRSGWCIYVHTQADHNWFLQVSQLQANMLP